MNISMYLPSKKVFVQVGVANHYLLSKLRSWVRIQEATTRSKICVQSTAVSHTGKLHLKEAGLCTSLCCKDLLRRFRTGIEKGLGKTSFILVRKSCLCGYDSSVTSLCSPGFSNFEFDTKLSIDIFSFLISLIYFITNRIGGEFSVSVFIQVNADS